jgi:hypothetical protein
MCILVLVPTVNTNPEWKKPCVHRETMPAPSLVNKAGPASQQECTSLLRALLLLITLDKKEEPPKKLPVLPHLTNGINLQSAIKEEFFDITTPKSFIKNVRLDNLNGNRGDRGRGCPKGWII